MIGGGVIDGMMLMLIMLFIDMFGLLVGGGVSLFLF